MRYAEIINEIELGGGVDSNVLKPFTNLEFKQLEMFKEYPPLIDETQGAYKPLGRIGKYVFAQQVKDIPETGFNYMTKGQKVFLLFDESGPCVGLFALCQPTSVDGSGYYPARGIHTVVNGTGYRVSTVKIDEAHTGQMLAVQCYMFLLTHVCDWLMADTLQTRGGAAIWRKMLNSRKFAVLVYDDKTGIARRRWPGKDFKQVYNTNFLHPIVTLPSKADHILSDEWGNEWDGEEDEEE